MTKLPEPDGQACWCEPLWPPYLSPFPKTGPMAKDSFMCFHPPFLIPHFVYLLSSSSFLHLPTRLPVNIWSRQCLCSIISRQSNRTKLPIFCPVACSRQGLYRPTAPLFFSPLVCPLGTSRDVWHHRRARWLPGILLCVWSTMVMLLGGGVSQYLPVMKLMGADLRL